MCAGGVTAELLLGAAVMQRFVLVISFVWVFPCLARAADFCWLAGVQIGAAAVGLDCNSNGVPDEDDIAGGTSEDCNSNGIPDECDFNRQAAKLTASDAAAFAYFGTSVAVNGDLAVIGAPKNNGAGAQAGAVYVYRCDGGNWAEEAKLTASDAAALDYFGEAVAVSGDVIVVGAWGDDDAGNYSGSAYVFRHNGSIWEEEAKLTASDAAVEKLFGRAVAVDGDLAVVGARGDDHAGQRSGAAYVYHYTGSVWEEQAKLIAFDGDELDEFGQAVSVVGDLIGVSSANDGNLGTPGVIDGYGSVYMFRYDDMDWVSEAKLTALDGAAGDVFGHSLSISGNFALVGAPGDDDAGPHSGSAYVFRCADGVWQQQAKLTASDAAEYDFLGGVVSLDGTVAVVGSEYDDDAGEHSGSAYIYRYDGNNWPERAKLTASDAATYDEFGAAVAVSADWAVIGAYGDDDGGNFSGSAYAFAVGSTDWNSNGIPDECEARQIETASSCLDHGPAGEVCLGLGVGSGPRSPGDRVDPRRGGVEKLAFGLNLPVASVGASAACEYHVYSGAITAVADGTTSMTVVFDPALPNNDCCTVSLTGDAEVDYSVAIVLGDANRDLDVTGLDYSGVKLRLGQPVDASNAAYDVNADGDITALDYSSIKINLGASLAGCP